MSRAARLFCGSCYMDLSYAVLSPPPQDCWGSPSPTPRGFVLANGSGGGGVHLATCDRWNWGGRTHFLYRSLPSPARPCLVLGDLRRKGVKTPWGNCKDKGCSWISGLGTGQFGQQTFWAADAFPGKLLRMRIAEGWEGGWTGFGPALQSFGV